MSEDDKTDDQKAVEGLLKDWPNPKAGAGSRPVKTAWGNPTIPTIEARGHTLTSVASLSAEMFSPDQSEMVDAYLAALETIDKEKVFLLDEGTIHRKQVGIETELGPAVTRGLARIKRQDVENADAVYVGNSIRGLVKVKLRPENR